MTDEIEQSKSGAVICETTEQYLDNNFELFNFTEDYYFIERIGIRLSYNEALIYSQIPDFHQQFLERLHPWFKLRACLYSYTQGDQEVIDRLKKHFHIRNRKLSPVLMLREVIELVFPFEDQAGLSMRHTLTPEYYYQKHEKEFIREVIKLVASEQLRSLNTSASVFHKPAVVSEEERLQYQRQRQKRQVQYPDIVVNLSDLERVSYLMSGPVSQDVVKVWRQYIDLRDAELKQGEILSAGDRLPATSSAPKSKRRQIVKKNTEWERLVREMYKVNQALSHRDICIRLSTKLGENAETIRRKTTSPKPRNKQK